MTGKPAHGGAQYSARNTVVASKAPRGARFMIDVRNSRRI